MFDDLLAVSRQEPHPDEERWQTIGMIGNVFVIVAHTLQQTDDESGRIISVRKATPRERRLYEEGDF